MANATTTRQVSSDDLLEYMRAHGMEREHVLLEAMRLGSDLADDLRRGEAVVRAWLPQVSPPAPPSPRAALWCARACLRVRLMCACALCARALCARVRCAVPYVRVCACAYAPYVRVCVCAHAHGRGGARRISQHAAFLGTVPCRARQYHAMPGR